MQRRSLFFLIVVVQMAIVAMGVLLLGSPPAGATGNTMQAAPPTSVGTIPVGPTSTQPALPNPQATAVPTLPSCAIGFSDVHEADYFYEPVRRLYCAGAISGYDNNTFRPFNTATRGQMVKIIVLARQIAIITPARATFSDVTNANPFYPFVETAVSNGFVSGYADGTFRWYNNVTRGQLSKIVVAAAGWPLQTPATPSFVDVSPANAFYSAIETASAHGAVSGYDTPEGRQFRWGANATRGQIAKIVHLSLTSGQ